MPFNCKEFVSAAGFALLNLSLGLAEISVGLTHLADCPVQPKIPIYLAVIGGLGILWSIHSLVKAALLATNQRASIETKKGEESSMTFKSVSNVSEALIVAPFIIWLVCGCVWIFQVSPTFSPPAGAFVINGTASAPAAGGQTYCLMWLYQFGQLSVLIRTVCSAMSLAIACYGTVVSVALVNSLADFRDEERDAAAGRGSQCVTKTI